MVDKHSELFLDELQLTEWYGQILGIFRTSCFVYPPSSVVELIEMWLQQLIIDTMTDHGD